MQGKLLEKQLNHTASDQIFKSYTAFRYAPPFTKDAISEMISDGVDNAIALSLYPQYSCSTTGSSMNELWRRVNELDPTKKINWKVIDRWATHPGLVEAFAQRIEAKLAKYDDDERDQVILLFSGM